MRVLRYELKLTEFGYMITSGDVISGCNVVSLQTTLPIKVTIPEGYEDQFDAIIPELVYDEQNIPNFRDYYRGILLGKNPDWYLYSCEVTARSLVLGYYNRKIDKNGFIVFEEVNQPIKFQLAVPHKDDKPDSVYDVYLLAGSTDLKNPKIKHYEARVTEYFTDGRRQLTFTDESYQNPVSDKFVYVDEYVD